MKSLLKLLIVVFALFFFSKAGLAQCVVSDNNQTCCTAGDCVGTCVPYTLVCGGVTNTGSAGSFVGTTVSCGTVKSGASGACGADPDDQSQSIVVHVVNAPVCVLGTVHQIKYDNTGYISCVGHKPDGTLCAPPITPCPPTEIAQNVQMNKGV
jgi:hypothetical protein